MLRAAADFLERHTAQETKSKPFFPTNDYRRIYIEIEAQRATGHAFLAPYKTYAEMAELLTIEVGWFVDERYLRYNFSRYTKSQCLQADIQRRVRQFEGTSKVCQFSGAKVVKKNGIHKYIVYFFHILHFCNIENQYYTPFREDNETITRG